MERNLGAIEDAQQVVLEAEEAAEQFIERGVAGSHPVEDAVELGAQALGLLGGRGEPVVLQGAIEPPIMRRAIATALRWMSLAG